jgi:tetratricopeptide (TPR) repeat protein
MRHKRQAAFIAILAIVTASFVVAGTSIGAMPVARWEFGLGHKFEGWRRTRFAARLYQDALKRLPPGETRWRSRLYYSLGTSSWDLGEVGTALDDFQLAVDLDSENVIARLHLGEIFLGAGAADRAGELALSALETAPDNLEALTLLGAAASEAGHDEAAEDVFKRVLAKEPGRVPVAIALAGIYNREERIADARTVLNQAIQMQPGSALPLLALGRLEERQGELAAAERAYRAAVLRDNSPQTNLRLAQFLERCARLEEARAVLRKIDLLEPALPTALPDYQLLAGEAPQALQQYVSALLPNRSQRPSRIDLPPAVQSSTERQQEGGKEYRFSLAAAVRSAGKRFWNFFFTSSVPPGPVAADRAALAARVIETDLDLARGGNQSEKSLLLARRHLGQYRTELDRTTNMVLQTEIALAEDDEVTAELLGKLAADSAPSSAAAQYVFGVVKGRSGQAEAARQAWLKALEVDETFVPARIALAEESLRRGDLSQAEAYVLPAVREEPANLQSLLLYARILLAQGRLPEARIVARRAGAVDRTAPLPYALLALAAEREQQYGEALLLFEQAVVLDPHCAEAIDGLIRLYRRGNIERSALLRMEWIALQPPSSAALLEVTGRLYAEYGWPDDAERSLRAALSVDPQRRTAAKALAAVCAERGDVRGAAQAMSQVGGKTAALWSAITAQQHNDVTRAIAHYEAALRGGEQSGVAANNLAWLYAEQSIRLDRALELAEQARAEAPQDPAILDTVGVVHLRRREYSDAVATLQRAAELVAAPGSAHPAGLVKDIQRHLQEAYLRAGLRQAKPKAVD